VDWTPELHRRFVQAVEQLGIDKAVPSRILDIILGIPLLLAALVFSRSAFGQKGGILPVVLVLGILGWTTAARVIRSSVITAKQQDYVQAARMLGASNGRILLRHILPNALAPMIVVLTIALGTFIATEATLSFWRQRSLLNAEHHALQRLPAQFSGIGYTIGGQADERLAECDFQFPTGRFLAPCERRACAILLRTLDR